MPQDDARFGCMFCGMSIDEQAKGLSVRVGALSEAGLEATFHAHRQCLTTRMDEQIMLGIHESDPRAFRMLRR
jgi:hypothetical protein